MKKEIWINEALKILIPEFLKTIPIEYQKYMTDEYTKYFNDRCSTFSDTINASAKSKLIKLVVDRELDDWQNLDFENKKALIIKDDNLKKLFFLSHRAFYLSRAKLYENKIISIEEANKMKNELINISKAVQDYNKDISERELSEALLDLDYASNQIENIFSLRMGREYNVASSIKSK